jgi:di/tricarboxylate transporter
VAPILALAIVAVAIVLLTGCIDADEAFSFVEGRLLALIFAMLAVGACARSHRRRGAGGRRPRPGARRMPPILLIWAVYFITSVMTELVSNNAIAVIMAPIAIALAEATGVDARPLLVAVMIAASACFATPIGYQTNMLVYGPGGYRFTDFMRVGIPLNISLGVVVCLAIPLIFPCSAPERIPPMALRAIRRLRDKLPDAVVMLAVVTLTGCVGSARRARWRYRSTAQR